MKYLLLVLLLAGCQPPANPNLARTECIQGRLWVLFDGDIFEISRPDEKGGSDWIIQCKVR